jgi:rod shape-determining protein MreC
VATIASKRPVWITLTVALLVHSVLISSQTNKRIDSSFLRGWILDLLSPIEKVVDRTLHGTGSIWDRYFALIGVHDENLQLRAQIDDLSMQLGKHREEILEAQRLRSLLGLSDSGVGKSVVARVIGRDPMQSHQSITIDKGRTHGIQPDSPVITAQGIVGRVIFASNYSSVVQLILDSQSGVGVLVLPSRRLGIIRGNGTSELDLDYIDDDTDLKEGSEVITSGQDRIYPKGLPVGVLSSVSASKGRLFKAARIRPSADLGRLEEVLCIIDRPSGTEVVDSLNRTPSP